MTEATYNKEPNQESQTSLLHSFAIASVLVVAGVAASAMLLSNTEVDAQVSLPAVPVPSWLDPGTNAVASDSWLDLADRAFTSGRITQPLNDNALYYFQQAVEANSLDERAREGLAKVVDYVLGDAENAIYQGNWAQARQSAQAVLDVHNADAAAEAVLERVTKFEKIDEYSQIALNQIATDRLLSPLGDNALHSYEQIMLLDPGSTEARNGMQMIAQRLLAKSQSAVVEGNYEASARYIDQARKVAPNLAGLNEAALVTGEFAKISKERAAEAVIQQELAEADAVAAESAESAAKISAVPTEAVLAVSDLQVLKKVPPVFPRRAVAAQKTGWVELNFRVNELGEVIEPRVVRSSDAVFERSALNAIRKWRFVPHIVSGVVVPVRSGVRFSFEP